MGYGTYDYEAHQAATAARAERSTREVFSSNGCHPTMNPHGVNRESRDSAEHPESVGVVFALDVSGSMGEIPEQLAKKTLPHFMSTVMGVLPHPQVLFMAFGNAYADRSPIQVGQFESDEARIDQWLARIHLEGGGGGLGESYDLAVYFGARHLQMDCWEKRKKKGYFFMTGDEVPFVSVDTQKAAGLIGDSLPSNIPIHDICAELLEKFHLFFLIPDPQRAIPYGTGATWKQLLDARTIIAAAPEDMASLCALLIAITEGAIVDADGLRRAITEEQGHQGRFAERIFEAVHPYLEAFLAGPLPAPRALGTQADPGVNG